MKLLKRKHSGKINTCDIEIKKMACNELLVQTGSMVGGETVSEKAQWQN